MHGPTCVFWANLTPFSLSVTLSLPGNFSLFDDRNSSGRALRAAVAQATAGVLASGGEAGFPPPSVEVVEVNRCGPHPTHAPTSPRAEPSDSVGTRRRRRSRPGGRNSNPCRRARRAGAGAGGPVRARWCSRASRRGRRTTTADRSPCAPSHG
jgi:hypothetical protein